MTKASASLGALNEANPTDAGTDQSDSPSWLETSKKYFQLTKPGIVFGNLVSVIGGFLLASRGHFDAGLFALATVGVSLIVASGCVFNNYIDRDIDLLMRRTQKRALARGLVPVPVALAYAGLLGVGGLYLLYRANLLSALLGITGFVIYVGVYSLYLKRRSEWQTLIGSLSGAMPPVIGYCVVRGQFDLAAFLLLLIFSLWQMPHSYAIAIVYRDDYANAGIPVLPVKRGIDTARKHILFYIPVFTAAALMLSVEGYVGRAYFAVIALLGIGWLVMGLFGARASGDKKWAYKMFFFSIIGVMVLSLMMAVDYL